MVGILLHASRQDAFLAFWFSKGGNRFGAGTCVYWAFAQLWVDKSAGWVVGCFDMNGLDFTTAESCKEYRFVERCCRRLQQWRCASAHIDIGFS